jgi:hypothetical protein
MQRTAVVIADTKYPNMWRVRYPSGEISDMVNRTRATDEARTFNQLDAEARKGRPQRRRRQPPKRRGKQGGQ